jgi:hypothetical protein
MEAGWEVLCNGICMEGSKSYQGHIAMLQRDYFYLSILRRTTNVRQPFISAITGSMLVIMYEDVASQTRFTIHRTLSSISTISSPGERTS